MLFAMVKSKVSLYRMGDGGAIEAMDVDAMEAEESLPRRRLDAELEPAPSLRRSQM